MHESINFDELFDLSQSTIQRYIHSTQTLGSYSTIQWEIFDEAMSGEEFMCESYGLSFSP